MTKARNSPAPEPEPPEAQATEFQPLVAIGWMLATGFCFVGVTALVKTLGTEVPAPQAAFLRFLMGLVFLAPVLPRLLHLRLSGFQWRLVVGRGVFHSFGVALWFFAMARLPLADVTALNYLNPILITLGAGIFLGDKLAARRLAAVGVALIGALIILRPGLREISLGHIAMLGTASAFAGSYMISKRLSDDLDPALIVALMSVTVSIGLLPVALPVWVTPTGLQLVQLAGVALLATLGHYFMTLAFRAGPMTVTQPVTFLQLVWAVLLGALVFGEEPDPYVIFGGGLILAAVSFITFREAQLKRRDAGRAVEATKP
ncbi:Permease of the drug/metabolite transporter (DMT) superfamily [Pseudooceanicola antarcticus]|uniref:Permease of the drug/metabolite transporter (DMT) superfamily n=2 Tax=Pseudooceanicola antarcticus TaxID=1247613 RepID=A0A285IFE9_9RHOB|nr:Permease of the drug/metabolite transporter (DMT) superfamily [Pseudooceanicola antarcticus]